QSADHLVSPGGSVDTSTVSVLDGGRSAKEVRVGLRIASWQDRQVIRQEFPCRAGIDCGRGCGGVAGEVSFARELRAANRTVHSRRRWSVLNRVAWEGCPTTQRVSALARSFRRQARRIGLRSTWEDTPRAYPSTPCPVSDPCSDGPTFPGAGLRANDLSPARG